MSEYTPTTKEIRRAYTQYTQPTVSEAGELIYGDEAEFKRWSAEHDRELSERVWEEAYQEGYVDGSCDREQADNPYWQGEK